MSARANSTSGKGKIDISKKAETLREIHKLQVQIQSLEREKSTHLYSKRSDFRDQYCQLQEDETKQTEERAAEKVRLKQQLMKLSHMVKRLHKELRDVRPSPEYVEKLKLIMEEIEAGIYSFKQQQREKYEELMKDERTTWQDIQALEKRFETWNQVLETSERPSQKSQTPLNSARDVTKDLPPEVAAFEKFVQQTGGHRGGWDEYDHQTFLKFRNRFKAKPGFLEELLRALPTKIEEEIRDHELWYQEYLFLNEQKKDSIKHWRDKKQEEKDVLLARAEDEDEKKKQDTRAEQHKKLLEEERHERLKNLNAWKVQKELEKAQEAERKLREELNISKKKEEERNQKLELKRKVMEHKKQKDEEEKFLEEQRRQQEEEQQMFMKKLGAKEMARFRERDQKALTQKIMKEKSKCEEEKLKEERLLRAKNQIEVPSDPNRLLRPTEGWKSRTKEIGASGGQAYQMPHRAVPSWRQGMS